MRKNTIAMILTGLLVGFSAQAASSNSKENSLAALKKSLHKVQKECKSDISKFCKSTAENEGTVHCLLSKRTSVTPACQTALTQTNTVASNLVDKTNVEFRKNCGEDMQKFCAEVPQGRGRILDCLNDKQEELSNSCKSFQAKVQEKIDEFNSSSSG